jgi:hypothetical protein
MEIEFAAKAKCKDCRGSGYVTRSTPKNDGQKGMYLNKTLCHCAVEIKKPEPDECVVPKVAEANSGLVAEKKHYASAAIPIKES